jgi:hypothetical protein
VPEMTPIANTVNVPPPGQSLQTMGSILGIQQARQNLQTGTYTQQSAAANAQQDQQKNGELQAAQQLAINGAKSGKYTKEDGSLDRQKLADDIMVVAPTYGGTVASQYLSQANEILQNQTAHQALTLSQKKEMGATLASLAADPTVDNTKVIDAMEALRQEHKDDPSFSRMLTSMTAHMPNTASTQDLQGLLGRWSAAATGEPQAEANAIDTGGAIQPGARNRFTGEQTQAGQSIQKTTPPALVTNAAGQLVRVAPNGGAASVVGGSNPGTAAAQTQIGTAKGITERVQQAQQQANTTKDTQDALERSLAIMESGGPATGGLLDLKKRFGNYAASAGMDSNWAENQNTLAKNLARYEASRATAAGLGGTDAARDLSHNGSPNTSLDKGALVGVIRQSLATEKALAAYANLQSKTQDPNVLLKNESDFRSIPHLIQGYEYSLAKTPAEADAFLQKHGLSKQDMAETRKRIKEIETR